MRWSAARVQSPELAAPAATAGPLPGRPTDSTSAPGSAVGRKSVNGFVVLIWALTGSAGFFWPVFPIAAWGIGLVMNAWDVYWRREITEQDIQHEMERADRRG